jgi:hypothetical protein
MHLMRERAQNTGNALFLSAELIVPLINGDF